jgi:hypothetical protein
MTPFITLPEVNGTGEIYMDCLRVMCGDTKDKSMIDLCCAFAPNTPLLGFKIRRYIDVIPREMVHKEEQEFFTQGDVLNLGTLLHWDVSICSDGIEHLSYADGVGMIRWMKGQSDKQILFTPMHPWMMSSKSSEEDPEGHHSVWTIEDFVSRGFKVIAFPKYHETLGIGAMFAYRSKDNDFERVVQELKTKNWFKL